jgi:hypothetical protein
MSTMRKKEVCLREHFVPLQFMRPSASTSHVRDGMPFAYELSFTHKYSWVSCAHHIV